MPKKQDIICWDCAEPFKAWKKDIENWGDHPHCEPCGEKFYAWVGRLAYEQN